MSTLSHLRGIKRDGSFGQSGLFAVGGLDRDVTN